MVRVLIDSNFLLAVVQFRIDALKELETLLGGKVEPILISPVEEELKAMVSGRDVRRSRQASLALKAAHQILVENVTKLSNESVDDVLLRVASENSWAVATNDRQLKKRLEAVGVATIYVRQRSHLEAKGL